MDRCLKVSGRYKRKNFVKAMLIRLLKSFLRRVLLKPDAPIVVASMGRSGSTLMHDAIIDAKVNEYHRLLRPVIKRLIKEYIWINARDLPKGTVIKTHNLPEQFDDNSAKYVYIYDNPREAALSILKCRHSRGEDWLKTHFNHLGKSYDLQAVCNGDYLGFYQMTKNWRQANNKKLLFINFQSIWDNNEKIQKFLDLDINLPQRRDRAPLSLVDETLVKKIHYEYSDVCLQFDADFEDIYVQEHSR